MDKKENKKKITTDERDTRRLSFVKKTNTSINYRLLSFTGGIFLCFHLLPIVKAVVNIFILSFCVLKLSCKGSCYINVQDDSASGYSLLTDRPTKYNKGCYIYKKKQQPCDVGRFTAGKAVGTWWSCGRAMHGACQREAKV